MIKYLGDLIEILQTNKALDIVVRHNGILYDIDSMYVEDEILYWILKISDEENHQKCDIILSWLECEAEDECWNGDIYRSAMERLGDCSMNISLSEVVDGNSAEFNMIKNENKIILEKIEEVI